MLPHESAWLSEAWTQTEQLNFNQALATLTREPACSGYSAKLKARMLQVRILLRMGDHLKAQKTLATIDTTALLKRESIRLDGLRAFFYQCTGDVKSFYQAVEKFADADISIDTEYTLLKADALLTEGSIEAARECLEKRINGTQTPESLYKLYNNLAQCDDRFGLREQKLTHLRQAWREWKKRPEPNAIEYLIHNLAIEMVRNSELKNAKELLNEVLSLINQSQPEQILMWHNVVIDTAREAQSVELLKVAYATFEEHFPHWNCTAAQKLTVKITRLRMYFNDGLQSDTKDFVAQIGEIFDELYLLSASEQLSALKEISHNITQVILTNKGQRSVIAELNGLLDRCDSIAIALSDTVKAQLETLPPALVNQRIHWLGLQHYLEKIRIRQSTASFPKQALESLFKCQKESAELHQSKRIHRVAIHAWMIICDEYVAYLDQFFSHKPSWAIDLKEQHQDTAISALYAAEEILNERRVSGGFEEVMVGVAYFYLKLFDDKAAAQYWMSQFDEGNWSLQHYAQWFRDMYSWVKSVTG
ncbi:hypothetical protein [Salinivibrio costicola]|nr:hypothetical protein [Salinivibrio costicola]